MGNFEVYNDKKVTFRAREWAIISESGHDVFISLMKNILKNRDEEGVISLSTTLNYRELIDVQYKSFLVYNSYGIHTELVFTELELIGEEQLFYTLNKNVNELFKSVNASTKELEDLNITDNFLEQFLLFNFLALDKGRVELKIDDIRKLLFLENKYKSFGDLNNKVLKSLINKMQINVTMYPILTRNRYDSIIFQKN